MRQLAAWESHKAELEELGCTIIAASIDTLEQATGTKEKAGATFDVACSRYIAVLFYRGHW